MKIPLSIAHPIERFRLANRQRIPAWTTHHAAPTLPVTVETDNNDEPRYIVGVLALYACIAVPLALYLNLWIDESYSLFATERELSFVVPYCRDFMLQPPAFFLMLWFWRRVSMSLWWARMLPVAVIGTTLWLAHRTAKKWFPRLSSAWVVLPLVLNPWVLYTATELRCYCLVLFCATALLYFYRDAFIAEHPSRRAQILYTLTAILALNTYYYLLFLLAGGGVALVLGGRWRAVRHYAVVTAVVAATFVPQFLHLAEHAGVITAGLTTLPDFIRTSVYVSARIVSTELDYFVFDERIRAFWFGLIVVSLAAATFIRWRHWTLERSAIPIMMAVVVIGYVVLTWKIAGETSFRRHFLVALIPLHFTIVAIMANFGVSSARALRVAMIGLAAFGIASSAIRYAPLAKVGDYRRVAQYIEARERQDEPIFLIASHTELPFRYYYRGENKVIPLPEHDPLERYDIPRWALTSTDEVREKLSAVQPQERIWVFADRPPDAAFYGVDLGFEYLEDVIAQDYRVLTDEKFYYGRVRQLEKK